MESLNKFILLLLGLFVSLCSKKEKKVHKREKLKKKNKNDDNKRKNISTKTAKKVN